MRVVCRKILMGMVLLCAMPSVNAAPQQKYQDELNTLNLVQHEIFSSRYYKKPQGVEVKQEHKIKKLINNIKDIAKLGLDDHIKLKLSRVKSGPLDKSITEMVEMPPGIQTHDGFVGDTSKGYGVKFSYEFN